MRTRWSATCRTAPSTSIRAPPRSTRRCMPSCRIAHVDHMHPDAIIAIAARRRTEALTKEIFGDAIGWLPWKRPGFELGLWLEKFCANIPTPRASSWKATACSPGATPPRTATRRRSRIINQAIDWLEREADRQGRPSAAQSSSRCRAAERRAIAARLMPEIRGLISATEPKVGHFDDFAGRARIRQLAATCARWPRSAPRCPDHFLRTKIRPLVIDFDPAKPDVDAVIASSPTRSTPTAPTMRPITSAASTPEFSPPMRDPNAVVYLVPGVGMITFARTRRPRGLPANSMSTPSMSCAAPPASRPMSACPSRKPSTSNTGCSRKPSCSACRSRRSLAGQHRAGHRRRRRHRQSHGRAAAARRRLRGAGRHRRGGACRSRGELGQRYGPDVVRQRRARRHRRGRCCPGLRGRWSTSAGSTSWSPMPASPRPHRSRTPNCRMWNRNMDILPTGYFLVAREAFRW